MEKDSAAVEFDQRKGEALTEIAELMEEYGPEPVRAAMSETLHRQCTDDAKSAFTESFNSDG